MRPQEFIPLFDAYLSKQGQSFTGIIIGGCALSLMGVISRETQDCDILDPKIPQEIIDLSKSFAHEVGSAAGLLKENWLNNGPASLKDVLPQGWLERANLLFSGRALTLHVLGRADLLKSKLFAYCDRQQDFQDCLLLRPTRKELAEAIHWLKVQDQNSEWPAHVELSLRELAKELGYEL